ncbi:MAG: TRAP transporter substrate-binding protein [Pseudomonadales bacterium]|jgi:TRAP-type C4-dicarboxylate transport system substrate-binding protein|tara:strand:+ start:7197 stop:8243 length:1047 start_codon:yes stop_codon:yes gene_type:complete
MQKTALNALWSLVFVVVSSASWGEGTAIIKAVGTWGNLTNYQKHEGPFWNQHIAQASNGQIIGEIKPQTALGLKGFEIMRLVKNGVFDFAFGLPGYVAADNAIFEGADLSALSQGIATLKLVSEAYRPTLDRAFKNIYNAKLMMLYPFPSQTLWCNTPVTKIGDLKGKRIRVYSTTLSDFVEGVGGTSVVVPFLEVNAALTSGVLDCAITGTMSAYTGQWYKVASHAFTLRVGWGLAFGAFNLDKWNALSKAQQGLLEQELSALNQRMWTETATEDEIAIECLTGASCSLGERGNMVLVKPSQADLEARDTIAREVILPRWAARCGPECAANWNATVGKVLGLIARGQ